MVWFTIATPSWGAISVAHNRLQLDGRAWQPKGVGLIALLLPPKRVSAQSLNEIAESRFGQAELDAIRRYGADTIRFQISQAGLDQQSTIFDPTYAGSVAKAVKLAEMAGFKVIVCPDWQPGSGVYNEVGVPSDKTVRAWQTLLGTWTPSSNVILEIFNEPVGLPTPMTWNTWKRSHEMVIQAIRKTGVSNLIIADGLNGATTFLGAPTLVDGGPIAFGIHPYFNANVIPYGPDDWRLHFGTFCDTHACIVTEWNAGSLAGCKSDIRTRSSQLLTFLASRHIGMVGWAFDYPDTLMQGVSLNDPTTLDSFKTCADTRTIFGIGEMLKYYFKR